MSGLTECPGRMGMSAYKTPVESLSMTTFLRYPSPEPIKATVKSPVPVDERKKKPFNRDFCSVTFTQKVYLKLGTIHFRRQHVLGGGVSPWADGQKAQYIWIKNPLHKHFAGMPMVEG